MMINPNTPIHCTHPQLVQTWEGITLTLKTQGRRHHPPRALLNALVTLINDHFHSRRSTHTHPYLVHILNLYRHGRGSLLHSKLGVESITSHGQYSTPLSLSFTTTYNHNDQPKHIHLLYTSSTCTDMGGDHSRAQNSG